MSAGDLAYLLQSALNLFVLSIVTIHKQDITLQPWIERMVKMWSGTKGRKATPQSSPTGANKAFYIYSDHFFCAVASVDQAAERRPEAGILVMQCLRASMLVSG